MLRIRTIVSRKINLQFMRADFNNHNFNFELLRTNFIQIWVKK